ncbi:hypothetical protein [Pimelobacter simplex]|uniref:Uncharacterized protein n=1 Tax=Nocardioides simplex TaxID=2045 RepID=A0A0A1DGM7_NOCSI|nr:hypothetical protein [Pimelobacter simplex]AIY15673.2 hypothetical protein KR76_00780 [Pimelobacter simplex]
MVRGVIDGVGLVVLVVLVLRAVPHLSAKALWFGTAAVLGPLVTQLSLSSRGYRASISLDLAYVAIVVVTAVWSRGGVWRYFPEAYRRPGSPGATLPKTDIGWTGGVAIIALFLLLEHFVGSGITGE